MNSFLNRLIPERLNLAHVSLLRRQADSHARASHAQLPVEDAHGNCLMYWRTALIGLDGAAGQTLEIHLRSTRPTTGVLQIMFNAFLIHCCNFSLK